MSTSAESQDPGGGQRKASSASSASSTCDPVLRAALRLTISKNEYASLHKYVLSRSKTLRRAAPSPATVEKVLQSKDKGGDDYNVKTIRHALRVFIATWVGMKGWDMVLRRMGDAE